MARLIAPPPPSSAPSGGPFGGSFATPTSGSPLGARSALTFRELYGTPVEPPPPPPTRRDRVRQRIGDAGRRLRAVPRAWVVALIVLVLLAAAGAVYLASRPEAPKPLTQADVDATVKKAQDDQAKAAAAAPSDATVAYQTIQPSLVLITTRRAATATQSAETATGAGVIVNADGTILTANHVVSGASSVTVSYADGTKSTATIASSQPATDIATLTPQTLPQTLVPATLGGAVQVGAPVFAVGHPLGFVDSLSAGVVSALDRTVPVEGGRTLSHLIQIDAAVNLGNSGGPLLDKAGQVVGIVTGLANPTQQGSFAGIGFAVPIATAGGAAGSPPQ